MRKLLMPILMTWALNKVAQRVLHPQGAPQSKGGAARGFNPNIASEFMGNGLAGHTNRFKASVDAFKNAWKNYRE